MARRAAVAIDNNFKGGLNTEATGLNFPEDACTETFNCVHDEKGRVKRRKGFDYEANYSTYAVNRSESVVSGYTWSNVAGDGSYTLRVIQVGSTLYFYQVAETGALSNNRLATTVDLTTFKSGTNVHPEYNECQFTSGAGYLIVVHPQLEPFYCTFDTATEVITATEITVEIRDFEGLDDGYGVTDRPTVSVAGTTAAHKYNLYNQGWYFDSAAALTAWDTAFTTLPSHADVWWMFKDSSDAFSTSTVANVYMGNAPAPTGHYILEVVNQDRTTASGIAAITAVTTGTARYSAVSFIQGRVFFAGLNYTGYSDSIYFSPIIERPEQFGQCYQINDPTSEELSDLLPSDGGVIKIKGIENVVKIIPLANMIMVFATNGIWAITGSQGIGFAANDYTVNKISSISSLKANSFIDVDGFPYWWTMEGIYRLLPAQSGSDLQFDVASLSDDTIRTFYLDIPVSSRRTARGAYNPITKTAQWVYNSVGSATTEEDYEYDAILTYNFLTGGFYPWTINTDDVKIHDVFIVKGEGGVQDLESVTYESTPGAATTDAFELMDETGDVVTTFATSRFLIAPKFLYTVSSGDTVTAALTFAEEYKVTYLDWETFDAVGVDYDTTFTVGYKLHSETQRHFQANYVFVFLEAENNSSCTIQGLWEFNNSATSNRWSAAQQVYNTNAHQAYQDVRFRRLKIRGKGRALQLKFASATGTPFTIIGWSLYETQNAGI
jgi:hypothetical protein